AAANPASARPANQLKSFNGKMLSIPVPQNWDVSEDQNGSVTITSQAGAVQNQQGGVDVGYGVMVSLAPPANGSVNLDNDTAALLRQMQQQNGLQPSNAAPVRDRVGGLDALMNVMYSQSMFKGQKEVDTIVTVAHPKGLMTMIFIAPESEAQQAQQIYEQ